MTRATPRGRQRLRLPVPVSRRADVFLAVKPTSNDPKASGRDGGRGWPVMSSE